MKICNIIFPRLNKFEETGHSLELITILIVFNSIEIRFKIIISFCFPQPKFLLSKCYPQLKYLHVFVIMVALAWTGSNALSINFMI